jgi:hypothetical protein
MDYFVKQTKHFQSHNSRYCLIFYSFKVRLVFLKAVLKFEKPQCLHCTDKEFFCDSLRAQYLFQLMCPSFVQNLLSTWDFYHFFLSTIFSKNHKSKIGNICMFPFQTHEIGQDKFWTKNPSNHIRKYSKVMFHIAEWYLHFKMMSKWKIKNLESKNYFQPT